MAFSLTLVDYSSDSESSVAYQDVLSANNVVPSPDTSPRPSSPSAHRPSSRSEQLPQFPTNPESTPTSIHHQRLSHSPEHPERRSEPSQRSDPVFDQSEPSDVVFAHSDLTHSTTSSPALESQDNDSDLAASPSEDALTARLITETLEEYEFVSDLVARCYQRSLIIFPRLISATTLLMENRTPLHPLLLSQSGSSQRQKPCWRPFPNR